MAVLQTSIMTPDSPTCSKKVKSKPKNAKEVFLVARDIKFAKALAGNDKKIRDKALKRLKKWFRDRPATLPFTEDDFMRIWKGLFYSMWMSDKPLIQEECAENISSLVHFEDLTTSLLFFKCGLKTLMLEWFGIDQLRLDKFLMFVRRLLRQSLVAMEKNSFKKKDVVAFGDILIETVLNPKTNSTSLGLTMHFIEIFLEEVAKVSKGKLHPSLMTTFLVPFVRYLAIAKDNRQISHIRKFVFHYLLRQSDAGLEFEERFEAWKKTGFAGGSIDAIVKEKVDNEDVPDEDDAIDEAEEKPLDPRAGRVNVELPQLKFSSKEIVQLLQEHKFIEGSMTRSKKAIGSLITQFTEMSKGRYPLGVKKLNISKPANDHSTKLKHSVNRLVKFERELLAKDKKPKKRKLTEETPSTSQEQPKKKKKKVAKESVMDERAHDFFARKLQEYFNAEESLTKKVAKKKIKQSEADIPQNFEYSFRRNSGTWYVYDEQNSQNNSHDSPKPATPRTSPRKKSPESKKIFETNAWDLPLEDGEVEIFVPKRRKRSIAEVNKTPRCEVVVNPFSKNRPPSSTKKVKIDLKLNRSQEFHEHHAKILSSPAIPFDADKKPSKPLLKTTGISSPIDPFYSPKQLNF